MTLSPFPHRRQARRRTFTAAFEQRELIRPGREAAVTAEVGELRQDCDESVVRALVREVIVVPTTKMWRPCDAAVQLEPRRFQEETMESLDRGLAVGTLRAQTIEPPL
jgi:hypothetical protein